MDEEIEKYNQLIDELTRKKNELLTEKYEKTIKKIEEKIFKINDKIKNNLNMVKNIDEKILKLENEKLNVDENIKLDQKLLEEKENELKKYKFEMFSYQSEEYFYESIIGILAERIRNDWSDSSIMKSQIGEIKKLCDLIGQSDLITEIDENIENIYYDGRWFRDRWSGPYGCDMTILEYIQNNEDKFNYTFNFY